MSLVYCIRREGGDLDKVDEDAINALVESGLSEQDAVAQHLASIDTELEGVAAKVEEAGSTVAYEELDLSTEARDARANEDYEPDTYYHGTAAPDIEAFEPSESGNLGPGVYITPNAESASTRAVMAKYRSRDKGRSPNVLPLRLRKDLNFFDVDENPLTDIDAEALAGEGYDGVRRYENGEVAEINVFDPANLRSTSADFDPEKQDSAMILYQGEAPQRSPLGLYSGVEQAVINMPLPQWKKKKGVDAKQLQADIEKDRTAIIDQKQAAIEAMTDETTAEEINATLEALDAELAKVKVREQKVSEVVEPTAGGLEIWGKLSSSAVKKEETDWIGVEEFLTAEPKRKFTRREVLNFVRQNGVNVEENVADDAEAAESDGSFDWSEEIDDDSSNWDHRVEDYESSFSNEDWGDFDWFFDADTWTHNNLHKVREHYRDVLEPDEIIEMDEKANDYRVSVEEVVDYIEELGHDVKSDMQSAMRDDFMSAAEEAAETEYMDNPYVMYTDEATGYEIRGNDDVGYSIDYGDGQGFRFAEDYSFNEAEMTARDHAYDYGDFRSEDADDTTVIHWADYVMGGDHDNYREIKLTLPDVKGDFWSRTPQIEHDHYPDRNIIAFIRVDDRELLADPTINKSEAVEDAKLKAAEDMMAFDPESEEVPDSLFIVRFLKTYGEMKGDESVAGVAKNWAKFDSKKRAEYYMQGHDNRVGILNRTDMSREVNTYFIDELQSDWISAGRKKGFNKNEGHPGEIQGKIDAYDEDVFGDLVTDIAEMYHHVIGQKTLIDESQPDNAQHLMDTFQRIDDQHEDRLDWGFIHTWGKVVVPKDLTRTELIKEFVDAHGSPELKERVDAHIAKMPELKGWMSDLRDARSDIPDAPFKKDAWLTMALKRAVVDAVNNGYEAIAWPNAEVLNGRWSNNFDYEPQYNGRMPKAIKKLTKQTPVQLDMYGNVLGKPVDTTGWEAKENPDVPGFYAVTNAHQGEVQELYADSVEQAIERAKTNEESKTADGYWIIPITDELRKSVKTDGFTLFQDNAEADPHRGSATFDMDKIIIRLTEASDLSTFLHESGHVFLEMEKLLAAKYGTTADQGKLLNWLGVDTFDDITTEHHEKFARGFERYLGEGKSPSIALQQAFAAFSRWLKTVYRNLANLDVELDDSIREVFDRMLASEAEIEAAMTNPAYDEFFRSKEQAGMSDQQWEEYEKKREKQKAKAQLTLDQKVLKELRDRRSKEWAAEKDPIIAEEKAKIMARPVHKLMEDAKTWKFDREAVEHLLKLKPGTKLPGRLQFIAKKGGVDPDEYAENFDYPSAKAMLDDIINVPKVTEEAEANAEARMIEIHGDMLNDGSIEQEARDAVHNEEQAELLLSELQALKRKGKNKDPINRALIKAKAKKHIQGLKFKEITPNKFYTAEIRAAKAAATATTDADKLKAKTQQLINHYLYREASDVRDKMTQQRRYIRSIQKRAFDTRKVADKYVQNMKVLANMYDLRTNPERVQSARDLVNWYNTQLQDPNGYVEVGLFDHTLIELDGAQKHNKDANFKVPTFDDLTADELTGVADMLEHFRFLGGKTAESTAEALSATRDNLEQSVEENGGKDHPYTRGVNRLFETQKRHVNRLIHRLPSIRNLMRKLDGFADGPAYEVIYKKLEKANDTKLNLAREVYTRFEQEMSDLHRVKLSRSDGKVYTLESGATLVLPSEAKFMMGLYWGIDSSREAIREGHGVTDRDVHNILSDLSPEQLELLNTTWKVNESLWPQLSAASVRMYGVSPPKLDPAPFVVNGVQLTGGHQQLVYDSTRIELSKEKDQAVSQSSIVPSKAGSLNARVGSGGAPVLLDINNVVRAIDENIHFIAFAETGYALRPLINSDSIRQVIEKKHGTGFYLSLVSAIEGVTANRPQKENEPGVAALMRLFRRAATYKHLAYSLRNTVQQGSALPIVMDEVGSARYIDAIIKLNGPGGSDLVAMIKEKSASMDNRASLVNREASEYLRTMAAITPAEKTWNTIVRHGFTPQKIVDSIIAYPAWLARYEKGLEDHGNDAQAVSEADSAVAESVGSGDDLQLGGIFQSSNTEFTRTFTLFGSWFNSYFQRVYRDTQGLTTMRSVEAMRTVIITPFITASIAAALVLDGPGDDEHFLAWMLKQYGYFMSGTVPLLRDIVSLTKGFKPTTVYASGLSGPQTAYQGIKGLTDPDKSGLKVASSALKGVSDFVPIPGAGNFIRLMDYTDSYNQGKEGQDFNMLQGLLEGTDKNR